jgi:hypothetical protein
VPTPSHVGVVPARASRRVPAIATRAAMVLVVASLPIAFNAWIDPARLVATRGAEREIARVLATGTNVTDVASYDDRAIEKHLAPMRARPEVLALGSSRMQVLRTFAGSEVRGFAGGAPGGFVNGAMQDAALDDMLGVYGLYDAPGRRPNRVVIGVDPWTESASSERWRSLAAERAMVMHRAGIPVSPRLDAFGLWARAVGTLATPEYFLRAVRSFQRYGTRGLAWQPTDRAQNAETTKLPDGSVTWPAVREDDAVRAAARFASTELARDARFHDFKRRAPGRDDALERFLRYLQSEGVSATVVLAPFPAGVYDASLRLSGDSLPRVERRVRTIAARTGARVVGSYDPRVAGVTSGEFFDESHLRQEALTRLVER